LFERCDLLKEAVTSRLPRLETFESGVGVKGFLTHLYCHAAEEE
jgi:hypothetical protein